MVVAKLKSLLYNSRDRETEVKKTISTSEKMNIILSRIGMTKKELAERWGIKQPSLTQKFKENNWKEADLQKFCDIVGYSYEIVFIDPVAQDGKMRL